MLDKYLAQYLSDDDVINELFGGRIFETRAPQGTDHPYVIVGQGRDIDLGQTADRDLTREIGHYNVVICGRNYTQQLRVGTLLIETLLKACRNRYIPSDSASDKMWVQCIILQDREQFSGRPIDGGEENLVGYTIPIRAGYDIPSSS